MSVGMRKFADLLDIIYLLRTMTKNILIVIAFSLLFFGCSNDDLCQSGVGFDCGNQIWSESLYVLPYPSGSQYRVNQGNNNTCGGHTGSYMFGYDFDMPIGSVIVAARNGTVSEVRFTNPDGKNLTLGNENLVKILLDDGVTTAYSHLKQFSIVVELGQKVDAGDTLGLSGNSGYTDNFPHLHFHASSCDEPTLPGCETLLVKFRNTVENNCGLDQNKFYEAI
jgi:hypothetical protein